MHSSVFSLKITVVSNENVIDCYLQCPFAHHDTDMLEPFQQQVMEIYKRHCDYIVNAEYLPVRTAWFYDVTMVDSLAIIDMGDESVGLWPQAFGVNCPFLLDKADPDDKNRFRVAMCSLYAEYTECIRVNSFFSDEREDSGVQRVFGKSYDPTEVAKALIIEAQEAGAEEMRIRRTNSGIAGRIATKIEYREQWGENNQRLDIDQQAELLALRLADEEIEYAKEMLR